MGIYKNLNHKNAHFPCFLMAPSICLLYMWCLHLIPRPSSCSRFIFFWARKEQDSQSQQDWDLHSPMYGSIFESTASGQAKALFEHRCGLRHGETKKNHSTAELIKSTIYCNGNRGFASIISDVAGGDSKNAFCKTKLLLWYKRFCQSSLSKPDKLQPWHCMISHLQKN